MDDVTIRRLRDIVRGMVDDTSDESTSDAIESSATIERPLSPRDLAGGHRLTGVGIFGEGVDLRLVARIDDVAYLFRPSGWGVGTTLEAVALRSLPITEDVEGDEIADEDDDKDEDEDEPPAAALWSSLWSEPDRQRELVRLVHGEEAPSPALMEPMACNFVCRPARLTRRDEYDVADGRVTPRRGVMDETSDRVCVIDERSGLLVLEVGLEWHEVVGGISRVVIPIDSSVNILPGTSAQITTRRQEIPVRPRRLVIAGLANDWLIDDVKVGNRSQLSMAGSIPGGVFASTGAEFAMDTIQVGQDLVVVVTYVGSDPSGARFMAGWLCDVADDPARPRHHRRLAVRWTPAGRQQGWMVGRAGEDEDLDLLTGRTLT